jgi:hypothetical protein
MQCQKRAGPAFHRGAFPCLIPPTADRRPREMDSQPCPLHGRAVLSAVTAARSSACAQWVHVCAWVVVAVVAGDESNNAFPKENCDPRHLSDARGAGSTMRGGPLFWAMDAGAVTSLTSVIDGYADVVDPVRVAEDQRLMEVSLER